MIKIKQFMLFMVLFVMNNQAVRAQACPDYIGSSPPYPVCADSYGDANGQSIWNWELTPADSGYCDNWYARSGNGTYFLMGSPFVNAAGKLSDIANAKDYTRAKGWELLQRKFGCSSQTKYPYFLLYNKYTGLLRVFVFLGDAPQTFTSIMMRIEATDSRTAITSLNRSLLEASNEHFNDKVGKDVLVYLSKSPGATWSVSECDLGFDPNVTNLNNLELNIGIFGVVTNTLKASITGTSATAGSAEEAQRAIFATNSKNLPDSSTPFNFTANGEKLIKFSDNLEKYKEKLYQGAEKTAKALESYDTKIFYEVKKAANLIKSDKLNGDFGKAVSTISGVLKQSGAVLGFIGTVVGFFGGEASSPPPPPSYTAYNLSLNGSLEQITSLVSMNIKVPGASRNNNNNNTYFNCPVGIFNIKEKPIFDMITYNRFVGTGTPGYKGASTQNIFKEYTSYHVSNDLMPIFNATNGLELVSAEAAIFGQIQNNNGNPAYDPFSDFTPTNFYYSKTFNPMKKEFEANRLLLTNYDADKGFHVFQTPYVDFKCIKGQSFTVDKQTNVWLRVKAVLKRSDDPSNTPILFVKDYAVNTRAGVNPPNTNYGATTIDVLPPYANYTTPFNRSESNINIQTPLTYNSSTYQLSSYFYRAAPGFKGFVVTSIVPNVTIRVSNSIYASTFLKLDSKFGKVELRAGGSIVLDPGASIERGSTILITTGFGETLNCGNAGAEIYDSGGNCYNITSTYPQRMSNQDTENEYEIQGEATNKSLYIAYPNPANDYATIEVEKGFKIENIKLQDINGMVYELPIQVQEGNIKFNTSTLKPGMYIIKMNNGQKQVTSKLLIVR